MLNDNLEKVQLNNFEDKEVLISLKNVSKEYKLYAKPNDRFKELFTYKKYHNLKKALNNISIDIRRREAVGIIGSNGAGKSTLLKLLTGIIKPTEGSISISGRVSAILELGAGFNPERSGLENIRYNCMLMGLSEREIRSRIDSICDFADIGEYIYQPVKMYSSGMIARLAFATAVSVDPDILIVDEALSVGDAYFQAKSIAKMKELMKDKTVIFVSHTMDVIRSFCKRAIYIKDGSVYMDGDVRTVTQQYETDNNKRLAVLNKSMSLDSLVNKKADIDATSQVTDNHLELFDREFDQRVKDFRAGTGEVRFIRADLYVDGKLSNTVPFGSVVSLKIYFQCIEDINEGGTVGYTIRNRNGVDVFGFNSYNKIELLPKMKAGQIMAANVTFRNVLAPGEGYVVGLGLKSKLHHSTFMDSIYSAIIFDVPTLPDQNWVPGLIYVEQSFDLELVGGDK
ncbi:ABC transporter ATP-binding protein [Paenibacillus phoenicis]|uniref:ABC transporter ATP-binding protein n=1 Tax=Paenibacillus phoenicis TaxID=554117 RepID=A0ABU5PMV8_9BACL|nr:ABC transporter ATP-binding protein [Paenibacillus phoenicis]MEA3571286.1 ABC transporter ATP-binding protein [Paenibacillus phoenicis]